VLRNDAAAFHGNGAIAVMMEAALELVRGACKRGLGVALAHGEGANEVAGELVMDNGRALAQCRLGINHRGQWIEVCGHQRRCILGGVAAFGQHHRDRLADVANLVMGEQRLLRIDDIVPHVLRPFSRQRELRVRHRRQQACKIGAAQGKGDAGAGRGAREIDGADARMRERAAHERRVQHVRQIEIGNEMPAAGEQAAILAAQERAPDEGSLARFVHA
jgi:hypothetical protein